MLKQNEMEQFKRIDDETEDEEVEEGDDWTEDEEEEESDYEEEYYEVESIVKHRKSLKAKYPKRREDGSRCYEFFVKWKEWDQSANTWEHEIVLRNCSRQIVEYWKRRRRRKREKKKNEKDEEKRKGRARKRKGMNDDNGNGEDGEDLIVNDEEDDGDGDVIDNHNNNYKQNDNRPNKRRKLSVNNNETNMNTNNVDDALNKKYLRNKQLYESTEKRLNEEIKSKNDLLHHLDVYKKENQGLKEKVNLLELNNIDTLNLDKLNELKLKMLNKMKLIEEAEKELIDNRYKCVACMERPKNISFMDGCTHIALCDQCEAKSISKVCPLCQTSYTNVRKLNF